MATEQEVKIEKTPKKRGRPKKEVGETPVKKETKPKKPKNPPKKRLSEQEIQEWDDLYQYVKISVMGYSPDQALPRQWALRLKGMLVNKYMETYSIEDSANYSYVTILNTFKYSMPEIKKAFRSVNFKDENHKFNLVMKIVERNINTVYVREKAVEKAKEKIETLDMSAMEYKGAEYQKKTEKTSNRLDELW